MFDFSKYLLAIIVGLSLLSNSVDAAYVTTNADVDLANASDGSGSTLDDVRLGTSGASQSSAFTNLVTSGGVTEVRTVSIDVIASLTDGTTDPVFAKDSTTGDVRRVVVVSALRGFLNPDGTASFTDGTGFLTSQALLGNGTGGTANPANAESIDFNYFGTLALGPASDIFNSPIAPAPPGDAGDGVTADGEGETLAGNPGELAFPGSLINLAIPVTGGDQSDTLLVFLDTPGNDGLLSNVDTEGFADLFGGIPNLEGFLVDANQTLATRTINDGDSDGFSDIDLLNLFYNEAGLGDFDDPSIATDDFVPTQEFGGDFTASFQTQLTVITGVVPEPSSIALFAVGGLLCAAAGVRRRRNSVTS